MLLALCTAAPLGAFHPHYSPPIAASIQKWDLAVLREQVSFRPGPTPLEIVDLKHTNTV